MTTAKRCYVEVEKRNWNNIIMDIIGYMTAITTLVCAITLALFGLTVMGGHELSDGAMVWVMLAIGYCVFMAAIFSSIILYVMADNPDKDRFTKTVRAPVFMLDEKKERVEG